MLAAVQRPTGQRVFALGTLVVLGAATLMIPSHHPGRAEAGPGGAKAIVPLYGTTEPAKNPPRLSFLVDDRKVIGWMSGTESFAGRAVQIGVDGKTETVKLGKDNTFTWPYRVTKPTDAMIAFSKDSYTVPLYPLPEPGPTVFFVVDRTVYRPTQVLHFAGFLRTLDSKGEFVPLPNRTVEVQLVSERKKTTAAKMKLTSDDFGRIVGSYGFVDADPLDTYTLSIPGYKGSAKLMHADFRKSKIKLKIAGAVEGGKLKLKFEAVDFLENPVPGSKVHFTAQVVRKAAEEKKQPLKAEEFVYHEAALPLADLEDLPEEDRLLFEAGLLHTPLAVSRGASVVAQFSHDINLNNKEAGEHVLDVQPEWLRGNYSVVVQGVLVDPNGREQRAAQLIPLSAAAVIQGKSGLQVNIPKVRFEVDEPIPLSAQVLDENGKALKGSSTVVAMRLSAPVQHYGYGYRYYSRYAYQNFDPFWNDFAFNRAAIRDHVARPAYRWNLIESAESNNRTMVTATAFQGDKAQLKLGKPGAYKLVVVTHLADGTQLQKEVGCVVKSRDELPALTLKLDSAEYKSGETLTGQLHSRYTNARVLLTLRDSTGIRLVKPIQLKGSFIELTQQLPQDLRYGCYVDVQYVNEHDQVHVASQFVRVNPVHRMLQVETTMKKVCEPGEKVKIDLQVNRNEPVDLVVSVYDQSLLGIAPDKSVDIRNFYLADERVRHQQARELLRRHVGGITVEELIEKARKLLQEKGAAQTPQGQVLQRVVQHYQSRILYVYDIEVLLGLAGVPFRSAAGHPYYGNWYCRLNEENKAKHRLRDLLGQDRDQWRVNCQFHQDRLFLFETHPSYAPQLQLAQNFNYLGYGRGGFNARGDAHFSASGNSMQSFAPEGQGFISHVPAGQPVELITADSDQSNVTVRTDFSDSAFFNARVRTDATGKASVEFKLPDSLTNWEVVVTAVSKDMHVGRHKCKFQTFKPIMVWPMLPRIFTEGDHVGIYASVHNRTDEPQRIRVKLKVENGAILSKEEVYVDVPAKGNVPVYWTFQPKESGFTQILMTAECAAGSDASLKRLPVSRAAAEQVITLSGMCKDAATLHIPKDVDLRTSSLEITFAPSLAADLVDTLDYLVEYPYGCVEQTMSRFLPAIKVAQVLKQFQIKHDGLNQRLPGCVQGGIKRLLELQQPDGGWGWNGNAQTHEMITPYALYGLLEAEKAGYTIPSEDAVQKGLNRLKVFIDHMGENQTSDRVYCMYVWAHRNDIETHWWRFIEDQLQKDRLSDYAVALALEMAVQKGRKNLADKLAAKLRNRAHQPTDVLRGTHWTTARFSRWGEDPFEITAAALKALVAYDADDKLVPGVLTFFAATKRGNRWNSTKDTAMIVNAICDYLVKQDYNRLDRHGLTFAVNSGDNQRVQFPDGLTARVVVPPQHVKAGDNRITFQSSTPGVMYRAVLRYWRSGRDIPPMDKGIKVTRRFWLLNDQGQQAKELKPGDTVPRGAYLLSEVVAQRFTNQDFRYALVENPKPSCCEIQPVEDNRFNQWVQGSPYVLREDRTFGVAWHHEHVHGHVLQDRCVLHAELAGDYLVPPAVVELMYQTEVRGHSGTFQFKVVEETKK